MDAKRRQVEGTAKVCSAPIVARIYVLRTKTPAAIAARTVPTRPVPCGFSAALAACHQNSIALSWDVGPAVMHHIGLRSCAGGPLSRMSPRFVTHLFRSAAIAAALCGSSSLHAQAPEPEGAPHVIAPLLVTGSHVPQAAALSASPSVTFDRAAIRSSGATDALRLLRMLSPVFQGNGNSGNEGNLQGFGESYVALRNLPTLVLLNGRRLANSPFASNTSPSTQPAVDLNTIPLAMIERVEVLKDSASTLYGSDAVGGVVNVILRKDYNGVEAGTRWGSDRGGDYTTREGWIVGGVARPRGSFTVGAQYFKSTNLPTTAREIAMLEPAELVARGQNPAVLAAHISSTFAGRNGSYIIAGSPLAVGAAGYDTSIRSLPAKPGPNAPGQSIEQLLAAGYYIPIGSTPAARTAGGTPSILNTAAYGFSLVVPNERRQVSAAGDFEVFGKNLKLFGDVLLSRTNNGGSSLAPAPLAGVASSGLTIPANNPYNLFGVPIGVGGVPNAPGLRTRLDEIGMRTSDNGVDLYRVTAGLRGEIDEHWMWEAAAVWSRADGSQLFFGGANGAVMNQLLTPLVDATGTRYVYDAEGRPLSVYTRNGRNVPVFDYFGVAGVNAAETIDALRTTLVRGADLEQRGVDVRVTGRLLELPAGHVGVALGAESRREATSSTADSTFTQGLALGYIPVRNLPEAARSTRAVFAEAHVPLASPSHPVPLAHRADLSAAVRYERIKPGGTAATPKLGLHWLPIDERLLVRATYSRGFVAPSVFALFGPAQGAVPTLALPEGNGQTGSGGATGRVVNGQFIGQAAELSNATLTPAKSTSYTYGIAYSPRSIRGLNLSADYYHIAQDKVGAFDYTSIVADLNARGAGSTYAPLFRFTDGTRLTTAAANQVTSTNAGFLAVVYNPRGDLWTDGLDLAANYRWRTERFGSFAAGVDANVLFNFKARPNPDSPYLQYARTFTEAMNGRGNPQGVLPGFAARAHVEQTLGAFRATARVNHLPRVNAPGTAFGTPAGTPNVLRADLKPYTIPSYTTLDLHLSYALSDRGRRWTRGVSVALGASNVFDRDPPFVPGGGSAGGSESNTVKSTYDIIGRFVYLELKKEF